MTGVLRPCGPNTLAGLGSMLCGVRGMGEYQPYSLRITALVLSNIALYLGVSAPLSCCCFLVFEPSNYLKALHFDFYMKGPQSSTEAGPRVLVADCAKE